MKLSHFLFIAAGIILFVTGKATAQSSILWEVSGNGLTSPSYIMGTLKFIGEKEFFIPAEVHASLKKCKIFAIEDQIDHKAQHEFNKAVHFPEGKSLKDVMSAEDYLKVTNLFEKEFGIDQDKFKSHYANLIPLALSITMTRLSLHEKVKYYDIELVREAKKNKLSTFSLESIEREAEALHKYPIEDQVKALLHSVTNFEAQKNEFQLLMKDYPHGDLDKIFAYTLHPMDNNPVFIEEFYYKRNAEWMPKIDKMMHDKPSFVAVGVSHLEGEKGILSLLKEKGYTIKAIPVSR
jgi:uncharacterized protein YbaP (TraB family)